MVSLNVFLCSCRPLDRFVFVVFLFILMLFLDDLVSGELWALVHTQEASSGSTQCGVVLDSYAHN